MAELEGYYINEIDLKAYITPTELTNVTEVIDGTETNVQRAIVNVCDLADGYLQNQYDLPLSDDFDLGALKAAISHIVIWQISGNYSSISDEVRQMREKNNDDAVKYLEDLSKGVRRLLNSTDDTDEEDKYYFDANKRIERNYY